MQRTVRASTSAPPSRLFGVVADLSTYPAWLDLVRAVEPAPADDGDPGPAHLVTLRATVGPLARSKRLRMVRSIFEPERAVRFERRELDGRDHAPWTLDLVVEPAGTGGSEVVMDLRYGGQLWGRALDAVLGRQVEQGTQRLRDLVAAG